MPIRTVPPHDTDGANCYRPKGMTSDRRGRALHAIVVEQMPEIERLHAAGYNFQNIVREMKLPMSHLTLYKYWKFEKGLR